MAKKRRQEPKPKEEEEGGGVDDGADEHDAPEDDDDDLNEAVSSEEEEEEEDGGPAPPPLPVVAPSLPSSVASSDGRYRNRQRLLVVSSRGITARYRHLLEDLRTLIPHSKKESKLDVGKNYAGGGYGAAVNEIAEVRGCHSVLFLECRKQDGYLWLGRTSHANDDPPPFGDDDDGGGGGGRRRLMIGGGPSVRFHVANVHAMDELKMTGNCMKGSRPILSFDSAFDSVDHLKLIKHLFVDVFGTPRGHPKSKPFVDRVMGFYYADGKIWVRNYQILDEAAADAREARSQKRLTGRDHATSLVEIGPRFVLTVVRVFRGSFGGQTLYANDAFVNPNVARGLAKREKGARYVRRKGAERKRKRRGEGIAVPEDPLAGVFG